MAGWMVSQEGGWGLGCCGLLHMLLMGVVSEVVGPIRLPWWGRLQYDGADVMVVMEQVVE